MKEHLLKLLSLFERAAVCETYKKHGPSWCDLQRSQYEPQDQDTDLDEASEGLCYAIIWNLAIEDEEKNRIWKYLAAINKTDPEEGGYWWNRGHVEPRIELLKKAIKQYDYDTNTKETSDQEAC